MKWQKPTCGNIYCEGGEDAVMRQVLRQNHKNRSIWDEDWECSYCCYVSTFDVWDCGRRYSLLYSEPPAKSILETKARSILKQYKEKQP